MSLLSPFTSAYAAWARARTRERKCRVSGLVLDRRQCASTNATHAHLDQGNELCRVGLVLIERVEWHAGGLLVAFPLDGYARQRLVDFARREERRTRWRCRNRAGSSRGDRNHAGERQAAPLRLLAICHTILIRPPRVFLCMALRPPWLAGRPGRPAAAAHAVAALESALLLTRRGRRAHRRARARTARCARAGE